MLALVNWGACTHALFLCLHGNEEVGHALNAHLVSVALSTVAVAEITGHVHIFIFVGDDIPEFNSGISAVEISFRILRALVATVLAGAAFFRFWEIANLARLACLRADVT